MKSSLATQQDAMVRRHTSCEVCLSREIFANNESKATKKSKSCFHSTLLIINHCCYASNIFDYMATRRCLECPTTDPRTTDPWQQISNNWSQHLIPIRYPKDNGALFTGRDLQSFTEKFGRLPSTVVKCSSSRPPEGVLGTTPPTNFHICSRKGLLV